MRPNLAFGPIDSVAQYLLYLSVVVIGIVVPLLIQRYVRVRNHRRLAAETQAGLDEELASNRDRLDKSRSSFAALAQQLSGEVDAYETLWRTAPGDPLAQAPPPAVLPVSFATVLTTAWDSARLAQALPLIPAQRLVRFAKAYQLLAQYEQSRTSFIALALQSSIVDAPYDPRDKVAIQRRIEALVVLRAAANHQAGLAGSALEAVQAARS